MASSSLHVYPCSTIVKPRLLQQCTTRLQLEICTYLTAIQCLQLVIYGLHGTFVPNENLQNPELSGAIHSITQYLITYLVPGGPIVPINAVIAAVNDRNETAEVAAAFNKAVAAGYIPQLEALLKQVHKTSLGMTSDNRRMYELFADVVVGSKADVDIFE